MQLFSAKVEMRWAAFSNKYESPRLAVFITAIQSDNSCLKWLITVAEYVCFGIYKLSAYHILQTRRIESREWWVNYPVQVDVGMVEGMKRQQQHSIGGGGGRERERAAVQLELTAVCSSWVLLHFNNIHFFFLCDSLVTWSLLNSGKCDVLDIGKISSKYFTEKLHWTHQNEHFRSIDANESFHSFLLLISRDKWDFHESVS